MIWEYMYSEYGKPTFWYATLWEWKGRKIDIHFMSGKDKPECFHTHPAYAIRVILWGGYIEELEGGRHQAWYPGMIGLVKPSCSHRIAGLRNGRASYSIWIRFKKRAEIELRGIGWDT